MEFLERRREVDALAADAELEADPSFRRFKHECTACLQQFERAQEWADLIRYLLRLQKVLSRYEHLPIIPEKVLFAKRLYQCLNPALPSGVHEKTLETIELIFARIGQRRLARDLAFYSEGIFPLYRHASYQVKPKLLDLFERYYVPLGAFVVPCLPGLVLSLLSAMEDLGSEFYHRAVKLLDMLTESTPIHAIMGALWGRLLHNASVRYPALAYLSMRFPVSSTLSNEATLTSTAAKAASTGRLAVTRAQFCPDATGSVLRALLIALQQGDSLLRRTALELLVTHFPLPRHYASLRDGHSVNAAVAPVARTAATPALSHTPKLNVKHLYFIHGSIQALP